MRNKISVLLGTIFTLIAGLLSCGNTQAQAEQPQPEAYIANNREYTPTVRTLFQNAKSSISILLYQARFYPEHPDSATNAFMNDIIAARKRGVEVRIVADTGDWNPQGGSKNKYLLEFVDMLTTSGCIIWEDSPKTVSHEKVILVDDNLTLVSSHNWSYYSTDLNNEVSILVNDRQFNGKMLQYFKERVAEGAPRSNVTSQSLDFTPKPGPSFSDLKIKGYPLDEEPVCLSNRLFYEGILDLILGAKSDVTIVQRSINLYDTRPNFQEAAPPKHPGEPASTTNILADAVVAAHKRGVKTTVILDKSQDSEGASNSKTATELARQGVAVFADDETVQTHAKLLVIDDDKVVVGSTNWTWPAFETGNEVSILVKSKAMNKAYKEFVNSCVTSGSLYLDNKISVWPTK